MLVFSQIFAQLRVKRRRGLHQFPRPGRMKKTVTSGEGYRVTVVIHSGRICRFQGQDTVPKMSCELQAQSQVRSPHTIITLDNRPDRVCATHVLWVILLTQCNVDAKLVIWAIFRASLGGQVKVTSIEVRLCLKLIAKT